MGVIDLYARVKKLEQGGAGGAEIDQIEADLTALENTVGDLVEDVSDKITLNESVTFADGYPIISITRIGSMCFMTCTASFTAGASAIGSDTLIGTLDESIRPVDNVWVTGGAASSGIQISYVAANGTVQTKGGDWCRFEAFWPIATTAPAEP